ncbi:hypothetical protein HDV06_001470 [Boothiomyces sp. JEL0866]|nr:hypothetical protein HDV06_001470 [Boothiomyces sp. JEL0866]
MFEQESLISVPLKEIKAEATNSHVEHFVVQQSMIRSVGAYKDPFKTSTESHSLQSIHLQSSLRDALVCKSRKANRIKQKKVDTLKPIKISKQLQTTFANRLTIKTNFHVNTTKRLFPVAPQTIYNKYAAKESREYIEESELSSNSNRSDIPIDDINQQFITADEELITANSFASPNDGENLWEQVREIIEESVVFEENSHSSISDIHYISSDRGNEESQSSHQYENPEVSANDSKYCFQHNSPELMEFSYRKHRLY